MKYLFSTLILFCFLNMDAQSAHSALRDGDQYYNRQDYNSAELSYRKAKEKDPSLKSEFNLANTLFQQERYEEAIDAYQYAIQRSQTKEESSQAYYNLGTAYFNHQDLEQAIKAFKTSVVENPNNLDAQYNLIICKELMKQKQQQQQQQQCDNPQPGEEGEKGEESEKQEQEQQEPPEDQEGESEEGEDEEEQEEEEEQQDSTSIEDGEGTSFDSSRLEKQTLDSIDAAKLLQIIESEEQKVQEKLRKFNSARKKQDKDW